MIHRDRRPEGREGKTMSEDEKEREKTR